MTGPHPATEALQALRDGELHGEERRNVEAHVESCDECSARLDELSWLGGLLREAAEDDAARFDPDRLWARLAPELDASPSAWERLRAWWTPARLVPAAGLVAVAAALALLLWPAGTNDAGRRTPPGPAPAEVAAVSNECFVDSVEADAETTVVVAETAGPEKATVIWLLAADEGEEWP